MRYIIRAVPEREHWIGEIIRQIPHLEIVRDASRNAMETFLRALLEAGDAPAVHLEDDVVLTSDFLAKAEPVIAAHPDRIVQFFSLRKGDAETGSRWMPGRSFGMNQCFYLPAGYSDLLYEYCAAWPGLNTKANSHFGGYDTMMAAWLGKRREQYWLHVPSLVQHRVTKSFIDPRRSSKRQSVSFRP
jgi:GR25 family glycosyltransferase involved in LPS biosynthesis